MFRLEIFCNLRFRKSLETVIIETQHAIVYRQPAETTFCCPIYLLHSLYNLICIEFTLRVNRLLWFRVPVKTAITYLSYSD